MPLTGRSLSLLRKVEKGLLCGADLINRYSDRFLFGTDEVAPTSQEKYLKVYVQYDPLWKALSAQASNG